MITLEDVTTAARRLDGVAHRTPVLTSTALDRRVGGRVFIKAENFQRTGSFKFRGAYSKISALPESDLARGVISISSGNHAQALALASSLCGTHAVILMPEDSPPTKVEATREYGAEVVFFDRYGVDMDEFLADVARVRELSTIHPYDDWTVIAGQGTAALELFEDVGELDLVLASVGGGGHLAGCATVAKGLQAAIVVVGVEPVAGDDTRLSLQAGRRVRIDMPRTIADGLQLPVPGELTFEVIRHRVDDVVTVTDDEIVDAMIFLFERLKVVAEPSGACALAALLAGKIEAADRRVGVILSGGNVGWERFCDLLSSRDKTLA